MLHSSINQIQENWLAKKINNYCDIPLKLIDHIQEALDLAIADEDSPLFHTGRAFYWYPIPYSDEYHNLKQIVRKTYFAKLHGENNLEGIGC